MKWNLIKVALISLFALFFSLSAQADEMYTLDPQHSYVLWHINHFGFSNPSGKWFVNGFIRLDKNKPQNSKVDVTIPMANIDTGIAELDQHLKSKEFFDVTQFPTATFISNKIDITGKDTAKIYGILKLHGVSKTEVLDVKLNKAGVNLITDKNSLGFTASTILNRSDFNINTLLPNVGDKVTINIEAEAYQSK